MRFTLGMAAAAALLLAGCSSQRPPPAAAALQAPRAVRPVAANEGPPRAYARVEAPRTEVRPTARASQGFEYRAAGSVALAPPALPGGSVALVAFAASGLGSPDGDAPSPGTGLRAPSATEGLRAPSTPERLPAASPTRAAPRPCPPKFKLPFCIGGT